MPTSRLRKDLDRSLARVRRVLIARYGEKQANTLIRESGQEYEALIPEIPPIGDRNPFQVFLLPTTRYLAVYRALQRQGRSVEDAGRLILEMGEADLVAIPRLVRRLIGYLWFSPWLRERLKRRATESQERRYSGGYVFTYVAGDGRTFDYGIDYRECASHKFLGSHKALELLPYVCAVDKVASELLGWGLSRTMTLAEGCERCDFRFKKGGKTDVPRPESRQPAHRTGTATNAGEDDEAYP